ncbi:MAG: hypothetical protein H7138_01745 [Myxococcales bacterium]|nr:hypothetical protein [Myxococcales bacterium]
MSKVTFHGLPAWVGALHGPTVCEWWSSDPAKSSWDRSLLNTIDLALTPAAAIAGRITIAQIQADDFTANGGRTTIGPLWPGGAMLGACWVSATYLVKLGGKLTTGARPALPGHDYEWTMVQYFDGEQQNRRFYGLHTNVVQTKGALSLVEVWSPGTSTLGKPTGPWWIDLAAGADHLAPRPPNQPGPMFLDTTTIGHMTLIEPKNPPFRGSAPLFAAPELAWPRAARC